MSAVALPVGGALLVVASALDPDMYDPRSLLNPLETPSHVLYWVALLLLTLGLPGLHEAQAERAGRLGVIGFLLALAGSALGVAVAVVVAYELPGIAAAQGPQFSCCSPSSFSSEVVRPGSPVASLLPVVVLVGLTFIPGYLILGIATVRAGTFPRWCGWLLVTGVLLSLATAAGPIGRFPSIAGSLLMGASFAGFAYSLWSGARKAVA